MKDGVRLAEAAESMIGVPFRLHGRDPRYGLDCIGLVAASLEAIGRSAIAPASYRLRNASIEPLMNFAELSGLILTRGCIVSGDVLLASPGPGQHHLMIAESGDAVIHAHAGLKRVVRQPFEPSMHLLTHWRLSELNKKD